LNERRTFISLKLEEATASVNWNKRFSRPSGAFGIDSGGIFKMLNSVSRKFWVLGCTVLVAHRLSQHKLRREQSKLTFCVFCLLQFSMNSREL
jgi:hypothetical protein